MKINIPNTTRLKTNPLDFGKVCNHFGYSIQQRAIALDAAERDTRVAYVAEIYRSIARSLGK